MSNFKVVFSNISVDGAILEEPATFFTNRPNALLAIISTQDELFYKLSENAPLTNLSFDVIVEKVDSLKYSDEGIEDGF